MSDDEFAPKKIASAEFPTAFRGFDPDAVRSYLSRLATILEETGDDGLAILARTTTQDRIEELEEENETLRRELRELELESVQRTVSGEDVETPSDPGEIDEHRAIELLGQETARVLESARSAAADIIKRSEADAAEKLESAEEELSAARKEARTYLTDKQAEVEDLVARVTAEAEESAQQVRDDADEHRQMVLEESSKILSDAEFSAEESEREAQSRAEQIVADAEAIRQQILSELVVERTKSQTDLEEMAATRDRLAMALRVARSEIDEMSERLEEITTRPEGRKTGHPDAPDVAGLDASVDDEVAKLAAELDSRLGLPPEDSDAIVGKAGDNAEAPTTGKTDSTNNTEAGEASADTNAVAEQTVIDLTDSESTGDDASHRADRSAEGSKSNQGTSRASKKRTNRSKTTGAKSPKSKAKGQPGGGTRPAADDTAASAQTATATALAERPQDVVESDIHTDDSVPETDGPAQETGTESKPNTADVEAPDGAPEHVDAVDGDSVDGDSVPGDSAGTEAEAEETDTTVEADAEKQRIATGLIEGFTTIELSEADIDLAAEQRRKEPEQELSNIITTVESRSRTAVRGSDHDVNRGDLRIEGSDFRGKLASPLIARDKALKGLDDTQRAMRRVVNDDQSDVLDRIRGGKGRLKVDELAPLNQQLERYLVPVHRGLLPVGLAGARVGGKVPDTPEPLERLEQAVARYIVDRLRIPVIQLIEEDETDDREAILDPIRSVYRDFRNGSLIDLVEDSMYEAFAIGVFAAIGDGAEVSWLLDPRFDPDPACEINADRQGLVKGDAFPSGHARPLAVPSCRCLVISA